MRSKESTGRRVGGRTSQRVSVCIQAKRGRFYLASGVVSDSAHCSERRGPPRRASEREREKKNERLLFITGARPGPARRGPATPVACAGLRRVGARPRCAMNINDRAPTTTAVDNSARPPPPPPPGVLLRQCRMISKFRAGGCVVLPATERSLARGAALCRYKVHDSPSSSSTQMTFFGGFDRSESAGRQSCD